MFIRELTYHTRTVNKVFFNRDKTVFATCSDDFNIIFYSAKDFSVINKFKFESAIKNF